MAAARAAGSSGGTTRPVPGVTTSSTPPTAVATAGVPAAPVSISETGVPSLSELSTAMSAAAAIAATSARQPTKCTRSSIPSSPASRSSRAPLRPVADDGQAQRDLLRRREGDRADGDVVALDRHEPADRDEQRLAGTHADLGTEGGAVDRVVIG